MSRERTRVYVGDLGTNGSKPELEAVFEKYGPLKSVWVARSPPGFAFIEFEDPRDADDAAQDMDGRRVCGVNIRCELAKPTSRHNSGGYHGRGQGQHNNNSRYKRSPSPVRYGRGKNRSPRYGKDSRSPSPRRSRSRSPKRGGSPFRRSPRERGRGYQ